MSIDFEDVAYEDSVSSDTTDYDGPTGEDFHLEMDYEDRFTVQDMW